jgi:hypothetical protein
MALAPAPPPPVPSTPPAPDAPPVADGPPEPPPFPFVRFPPVPIPDPPVLPFEPPSWGSYCRPLLQAAAKSASKPQRHDEPPREKLPFMDRLGTVVSVSPQAVSKERCWLPIFGLVSPGYGGACTSDLLLAILKVLAKGATAA